MATKKRAFDATQTLDSATEAAETGIATVTALRREIGVPVREIPLGEIVDNPDNPRSDYDEADLAELAASIAEVGVLQPIVVRGLTPAEREQHPGARFLTVAGHRRRRAAAKAQLDTIPSVERSAGSGAGDLVLMLTENMQRQDLKPLDEARSFKILSDSGMTQTQISKALGISQGKVSKRLALLELEPSVQATIAAGVIAAEAAEEFRGTDHEIQRRVTALLQSPPVPEHRPQPGDESSDEPAKRMTATAVEIRDSIARARRLMEQEARQAVQEEAARVAGARILGETSKYADHRRQLYNHTPGELAKLAAAGHLGAQTRGWSDQPVYYNTDPDLLKRKADSETRRRDNQRAKADQRRELLEQTAAAMPHWAQQFTVKTTDAADQLAAVLLEEFDAYLGTVYEWLNPDQPEVADDVLDQWVKTLKPAERPRIALLAIAARDLSFSDWNAEARDRIQQKVQQVDPQLADRLGEVKK